MKTSLFASSLLVLFLLHLASPAAWAQEFRGAITGRVTDTSGAVIPGAGVTVLNKGTGVSDNTQTNAVGLYEMRYLVPGVYKVTVERTGFKRDVRDGIEVRVNDQLQVDIVLQLGEITETVSVTGETPLLQTTNASLGTVVDSRRIAELPIAHGNTNLLLGLAPGAVVVGATNLDTPFENRNQWLPMNGVAPRQGTAFTLDGSANTYNYKGGNDAAYSPPAEIVSEFKLETAPFDASVGNSSGAVVNVSLKSGTNDLHGTATWTRMPESMTANLFFNNRSGTPRGEFNYNRWGATLSGPVTLPKIYNGKNRTFFLFGYEGIKESEPRGNTFSVPTLAERQGDFSQLLALGGQYQIYDPFSRRAIAGGRFQVDPLPGNIVPASKISSVANKILRYWPEPLVQGEPDGVNNYPVPGEPITNDYYNYTAKIDHYLTQRHKIFGRLNTFRRDAKNADWFHNIATGHVFRNKPWTAGLDWVYTATPTLLVNVRAGYVRYNRRPTAKLETQGFDLTSLGFPASYNNAIPAVDRYFPLFNFEDYADSHNFAIENHYGENRNLALAIDKVAAAHSLKFGLEYRAYISNRYQPGHDATGSFTFNSNWTKGPLDTSAAAPIGQDLASMLFGLISSGYVDRVPSIAQTSSVWSLYFQDNWKVTPRLTVNLGLRYEVEGPITERFNRTVRGFDPNASLPIADTVKTNYAKNTTPEVPASQFNIRGGLDFAGVAGQPRTLWDRDLNNFMPRVGLAYRIGQKTVLRGGYGVFYGYNGILNEVIQTGFRERTSMVPSLDGGLTYHSTLANPLPDGIKDAPGASLGGMTFVGQAISFVSPQIRNPYNHRFQAGIERQLPHRFVLDLAYVGNRGGSQPVTRNLNAVSNEYLSTSPVRDQQTINYLNTKLSNPFYPLLPGTSLSSNVVNRSQLLLPFPQFTAVRTDTNEGSSWYNALQVQLEKRFSQGYTLQAAYTWSKLIEATSLLNEGDLRPERVISAADFPHRLTVSGIWELPFGEGRRWGAATSSLPRHLISGWQIQGIYVYQIGAPMGFGNALFYGDIHDIALDAGERTIDNWFNTTGFERSNGKALAGNLRSFPSLLSGVRSDSMSNWDLSIFKKQKITEKVHVQIRGEFLNAFNTPYFAAPNTNQYSSAFGKVTAQYNLPRRIQLGLKLVF